MAGAQKDECAGIYPAIFASFWIVRSLKPELGQGSAASASAYRAFAWGRPIRTELDCAALRLHPPSLEILRVAASSPAKWAFHPHSRHPSLHRRPQPEPTSIRSRTRQPPIVRRRNAIHALSAHPLLLCNTWRSTRRNRKLVICHESQLHRSIHAPHLTPNTAGQRSSGLVERQSAVHA